MYKDVSKIMGQADTTTSAFKLQSQDTHGVHMTGEIIDKIYKNGVLVDTIVGHNLVVNSFLKLVMLLIKNQNNYKVAT